MNARALVTLSLSLSFSLSTMLTATGCGAAHKAQMPSMRAMAPAAEPPPPAPLQQNHFRRDGSGSISEADLHRVLAAPIFLEADSRIGVVPVVERYETNASLPLIDMPGVLAQGLESTGHFEIGSEISVDWPAAGGISGLRELAARYRCEYLILYRSRFADAEYSNSWALAAITVVGAFIAPMRTLSTAGVLEATMFDVKTGTILFTAHARVRGETDANIWHNDRKREAMKEKLMAEAAKSLVAQVDEKVQRLVAARPTVDSRSDAPIADASRLHM